jgi:hypothetical protein
MGLLQSYFCTLAETEGVGVLISHDFLLRACTHVGQ